MTDSSRLKLKTVYVTYINSTREKVWQALTSGEFTARYWGGRRIESDWQVGSTVRHIRPDGGVDWEGEVLMAEPPAVLSYTFHMLISEQHRSNPPSQVTFRLEPHGGVTRLTLVHEHAEPDTVTEETTGHGWPAILSSLKSLLEVGRPLPFPSLGFGPCGAEDGRVEQQSARRLP